MEEKKDSRNSSGIDNDGLNPPVFEAPKSVVPEGMNPKILLVDTQKIDQLRGRDKVQIFKKATGRLIDRTRDGTFRRRASESALVNNEERRKNRDFEPATEANVSNSRNVTVNPTSTTQNSVGTKIESTIAVVNVTDKILPDWQKRLITQTRPSITKMIRRSSAPRNRSPAALEFWKAKENK